MVVVVVVVVVVAVAVVVVAGGAAVVVVVGDPTTLAITPGALPDIPGPAQSIMSNRQKERFAQIRNKI